MRIKDFIVNQWVAYADYDNRRSLPHIMDGLKITQRKALYTALNLPKNEKPMKVSQFAAKAAELTSYHHGDTSMISTVVGLAQDYPGSNNYPLLQKHGQFGSRLSNEAAAPRYIHTKLHENWDKFFKPEDQEIVEYLYDDGEKIEPKYFIPVIPMLLINGCDGVGNGFKSSILNYEVSNVVNAIKELIKSDKVTTPLIPAIKGWTGSITKSDKQVVFTGILKVINTTTIHITELPPDYDNEKYKKLLNDLIDDGVIKDYENLSTEDKWEWIVKCPRQTTDLDHDQLLEKFGLIKKVSENFVCWGMDDEAAPLTFDCPEALLKYWYTHRLELYKKSLSHRIEVLKNNIIINHRKSKFIKWCIKNDFKSLTKQEFIDRVVSEIKGMTLEDATKYVSMSIYKITKDEARKLEDEIETLVDQLEKLESTTAMDIMKHNIKNL